MTALAKAAATINADKLTRVTVTGLDNTSLDLTIAADGKSLQITKVLVNYDAAPTCAAPTVTLAPEPGAAYETPLVTGLAANTRYNEYTPTNLHLLDDDSLVVHAAAGGVGIIASATVYYLQ